VRASYLLRRFLFLIFVVWTAATLLFLLPRLSTINPIRERFMAIARSTGYTPKDLDNIIKNYQIKFGLDKPLGEQYVDYMGGVLRGDLGVSLMSYPKTVNQLIGEALPWTLGLISVTTVLTFLIGGRSIGWMAKKPALGEEYGDAHDCGGGYPAAGVGAAPDLFPRLQIETLPYGWRL
jgi:peptide/nickel transport system permease protein